MIIIKFELLFIFYLFIYCFRFVAKMSAHGRGGGYRGRGRGGRPGGSGKEDQLKSNLEKTIKDAEKLLKERKYIKNIVHESIVHYI